MAIWRQLNSAAVKTSLAKHSTHQSHYTVDRCRWPHIPEAGQSNNRPTFPNLVALRQLAIKSIMLRKVVGDFRRGLRKVVETISVKTAFGETILKSPNEENSV